MRTVNVLLIAMFTVACRASPPTYDQAVALSGAIPESIHPEVKDWMNGVFTPFAGQHFETMVTACAEALVEGSTTTRFVIDVQAAPERVAVQDEAPTPFSKCLKAKLEALTWPKPPVGLHYLPIAINANKPKDGPQNADDVIISITPSNNSLERTRER
jgi:hypothetical protein